MKIDEEKCNAEILEIVKQLDSIIRKYNPQNNYFTFTIMGNGNVSFNNRYWHTEDVPSDENFPIRYWENIHPEEDKKLTKGDNQ